jgi:trk system potassium uptake protein
MKGRYGSVLRIIGMLMMLFSLSMLPPAFVSLFYHDAGFISFLWGFFVTLFLGGLLYAVFFNADQDLKTRDGFLVVVLFWTVLSLCGAIPFMLDPVRELSFTDAFFVSVSGLTTTGASVMSHLDVLPRSILYYRQQLHFLGGMGIIVLAVAILPMLGVGGIQLAKAETAGPVKTTKLKPRIAQTAKALWGIYAGLTVLCALCYWAAGMSLFDAIGESYSTIATGGYTLHDASFAFYHSHLVNIIAIVFMVLGATNFALHFRLLQTRSLKGYFRDTEFKAFLTMVLAATALVSVLLAFHGPIFDSKVRVFHILFSIVSVATTTGFITQHFDSWPTFLPYMVMTLALIGGCASSTSGGMKVVRLQVIVAQVRRELFKLAHPRAVVPLKLGKKSVPESIAQAVWGYVGIYIFLFFILFFCLLAMHIDFRTAIGALVACLSNTGAAIGKVANGFELLSSPAKWVLIVAMFLGRLEIFTILVLFMPTYWRH